MPKVKLNEWNINEPSERYADCFAAVTDNAGKFDKCIALEPQRTCYGCRFYKTKEQEEYELKKVQERLEKIGLKK